MRIVFLDSFSFNAGSLKRPSSNLFIRSQKPLLSHHKIFTRFENHVSFCSSCF